MKKILLLLGALITMPVIAEFTITNYLDEPVQVLLNTRAAGDIEFTVKAATPILDSKGDFTGEVKSFVAKKSSLARQVRSVEVLALETGRYSKIKPQGYYYDEISVKSCKIINPAICGMGEKRDIPQFLEDPDDLKLIGRNSETDCGGQQTCQ